MPTPTIESIRKELRGAIFGCAFWSVGLGIEGRFQEKSEAEQKACAFAEFGVRTGLFSSDEGDDWLDAIWGIKVLADIVLKYEDKQNV